MEPTFYGVLGVGPDADREAIERGYRERVTSVHPDVNDDPNADAEFRRLTTARDTLLDADERSRYDRLGHASYVCHHVSCGAWESTAVREFRDTDCEGGRSTEQGRSASTGRDRSRSGSSGSRDWNSGRRTRSGSNSRSRGPESAGAGGDAAWTDQSTYATSTFWESHRVGQRSGGSDRPRVPLPRRLLRGIRSLGVWALIHVLFLVVAVGTSWYVYVAVLDDGTASLSLLVVLVGEVILATLLSSVHVLTRSYR